MADFRRSLGLGLLLIAAAAAASCGGSTGSSARGVAAPGEATASDEADGRQSCLRRHTDWSAPKRIDSSGIGSTLVLAQWGGRSLAYVADADDRSIQVVDIDTARAVATTPLDGTPSQLIMLADGRLVVGMRDRSKLYVLEPGETAEAPLERRCSVSTPPEPVALALTPNDGRLLVTTGWGRSLTSYDTARLEKQMQVKLDREPRAVASLDGGKTAIVVHAVGGQASIVDLQQRDKRSVSLEGRHDHEIEEFRKSMATSSTKIGALGRRALVAALEKMNGQMRKKERFRTRRTSCQSFALAKTSEATARVFVPQVLVDPGNSEQRTVGYGDQNVQTEMPSIAVLDSETGYPLPNSLRISAQHSFRHRSGDTKPEHCILPRAAAIDETTQSLLVSCFGTDEVVAYDMMSAEPVMAERRRWRVAAGPSGIAVEPDEHRAVVWSQFERTLNIIPLGAKSGAVALEKHEGDDQKRVRQVELEPTPGREMSIAQALGRSLFHASGDTRISRDGRACASCHPDGRDDALVWATPNGPRRTKMLAGMLAQTAPYAWDGGAERVRDHVVETFQRLNGVGGVRGVELRALVAYLESLTPPPAPVAATRGAKARRGQALFASKQVGCAKCHAGSEFTDNKAHDVKSKTRSDRLAAFNTPSLRYLSGRAPYYHDGRFATLSDLLQNSDGDMGHTKHLSDDDIEALEAYLETL
jgi:mono/diheme cytochrome c family protein